MSNVTILNSMDYARVVSRKKTKGSGLDIGQTVLIIGMRDLPQSRADPYLLRRYATVILVDEDGTHHMPNMETGEGDDGIRAYLVDPRSLEKLGDEEAKQLSDKYRRP